MITLGNVSDDNRLKFKDFRENYPTSWRNLENIRQVSDERPKDVNMEPVELGNTRISTKNAQKSL